MSTWRKRGDIDELWIGGGGHTQTDRQTDRQTHTHTHTQTDRQTDRQTDTHTHTLGHVYVKLKKKRI